MILSIGMPRYVKVTPAYSNRRYNNICQWHNKRPQPWTWANDHGNRKSKHWNWQMINAKEQRLRFGGMSCVPFALYKWKAFGFDGKHQPTWTIADYVDMAENYEDPSDYIGMGWIGADGRP